MIAPLDGVAESGVTIVQKNNRFLKIRRLGAGMCASLWMLASGALHAGIPYTGSAKVIPSVIQAVDFDKGGEGAGYHDLSSSNEGGAYRPAEGVDIVSSTNLGRFVVNNFRSGEWLAYTVTVASEGQYDFGIQASNNGSTSGAFHIEVDGVNVTGRIAVAPTGSWDTYQWVGTSAGASIRLAAGQHVVKLVRISSISTSVPSV
jgi:hypothetical protein